MSSERYERAGEVFHAALAVAPDERAALVAAACAGDDALRREVESLLAAHGDAVGFIERPAMEVASALIADGATVPAGTRIGRYEVLAPIGCGGMGEVYRARDVSLGRDVALKLPRRPYTASTSAMRRFEQEARAASSLNHPNIVTVHEIGDADGRRFIAMELVDGQPLAETIGPPLSPRAVSRIGRQLAQALAVAHAAGIVHGDIKPENVMVRGDGYVKVLDFGVARLAAADGGTTPSAGAPSVLLFGTPRYMAPEQAQGDPATTASDVFACGVVLYELATGRQPASERPAGDVPPLLGNLLQRMLDPRPEARPSASEAETALAAIEGLRIDRLDTAQSHLPAPRTGFVGRDAELAALESMVLARALRLTTLTGPGGTGKTRLALELAARLTQTLDGSVSFVPLAAVTDSSGVASSIARTLGVSTGREGSLIETLIDGLRRRGPTLLVLDNFEHLTEAAGVVHQLLDTCPALSLVVTSRIALRLYGEHEFPVAPLTLPEDDSAAPAQLMEAPAVQLFVQRAAAVRPEFALTSANSRAVADICRRLDGLPLAIELAAARVKILPPADLRARLDRRLELLTDGPRDLPPRQRTLRSTIDWSYDLLPAAEQRLFRRMSVFSGGCSLESIEGVCDASEDLGVDPLRGVTALVDNSLVVQRAPEDGQSRFVMLETVREYARWRLDESGEAAATLRAHAAYALVVAEEGTHGTGQLNDDAWLRSCDAEHDNLRAALTHLAATGHEWGLRLGVALFRFWQHREHFSEGRELLGAVLASSEGGASTRLRAQALYYRGVLSYSQRDFASAATLIRESLTLYQTIGDARGEAVTKGALAWQMVQLRGSHAEALALIEEAAALWERLGDPVIADQTRSNLATAAQAAGNPDLARTLLEHLADASERRGDIRAHARALNGLGDVAAACGDADGARRHHQESLARFRQIDDRDGMARALADLADLDVAAGDFAAASASLTEALHAFERAGQQRGVARELETLAWCLSQRSQHASAVTLAGAAAAIRQRIRVPTATIEQRRTERALADARRLLPAAEYERAWSAGAAMTVQQLAQLVGA